MGGPAAVKGTEREKTMSEQTIPVHVTQHFGQRIAALEAEVKQLKAERDQAALGWRQTKE